MWVFPSALHVKSHLPDSIGHSPCQRRLSMATWMTRLDRKSLEDAHICACDRIELLCKMQQHRWPCCSSSAVDSQKWQCHPPSTVTILSRPRSEESKIYRKQRWMMPYCIGILLSAMQIICLYFKPVWISFFWKYKRRCFIFHWFYSFISSFRSFSRCQPGSESRGLQFSC